jgi:hypothetical protein
VDITVSYTIRVIDANDHCIVSTSDTSKSFTTNFLRLVAAGMNGAGIELIDTSGMLRTVKGLRTRVGTKDTMTYGILLGSGLAPVSLTDYKLDAQIIDPNFIHQPMGNIPLSTTSTDTKIHTTLATRLFTNIGGTVNINEMGMVAQCTDVENNPRYALIIRDVFDEPYIIDSYNKVETAYHLVTTL